MKTTENLRRIMTASISGSFLFSSTFVATSAHYGPADIPVASGKAIPSYEQLAKNERHFPLAQTCGGENYIPAAQEAIRENFDSKCLSKANTKLVYSVLHADSGIPVFKIISAENATETDKFYCEQAIWEFIMTPACRGGKLTCEFSGSGKSGRHPELLAGKDQQHVALHLIPQCFPFRDLMIDRKVIADRTNVVRLNVSKLRDPRLMAFRLEWFTFWHPPVDPEKLVKNAAVIREKYSGLFDG